MPGLLLGGRYEAAEVLGHGGVGEVLAGRDRRLDRDVAIKLLRPEVAQMPGVAERFENEARMAARLVHPHIVAVFDFGVEGGVPYLVMERLSGTTLADVVAGGPIGFDETEQLGMQVLDAVAAAHAAGMIHRDIKPRNVLVAGTGCWKVGDFGIAKSMDAGADAGLTMTGLVVGTPAYLAPERLTGGPATVATDIYGVGVVLYQALTGRSPFDAGLPLQALAATVPRPVSELRPGVPAGLAAVVTRAMARDPSARFASAAEMAAALPGLSGPVVAFGEAATPVPPTRTELFVPPTVLDAPRRALRDHRLLATGVAAVALVLILSLVVLLSGGHAKSAGASSGASTTVAAVPAPTAPAAPAPTAPAAPAPTVAAPTVAAPVDAVPPALDAALNRLAQAVRP